MDIFKKDRKTLDKEVERVLAQMESIDVKSKEYAEAVANLKVLCEARANKSPSSISMDTLVSAGASILGILIILNYEKANIITSKSFGMIFRGKS